MAETMTMDRTSYYYVQGKRMPLVREARYFAVRFVKGERWDSPTLSLRARRLLDEESDSRAFIPHYGLYIFETKPVNGAAPSARMEAAVLESVIALREEPAVELAAVAVRRDPESTEVSFVTRQFIADFKPAMSRADIDALNATNGVRIVRPAEYLANGFVLEAPEAEGPRGPVALANLYIESGAATLAHADFIERRYWRATATAQRAARARARAVAREGDFLNQQWHLRLAKVEDAWAKQRGSSSVTVAILDDGVDLQHAEFQGKIRGQFDFATHQADASPKSDDDKHGTSCAGVAVARGAKAFGSAPGCSLLAVRTPAMLGVADEADMFRWVTDQGADVISCSWGPPDNAGPFTLVDNVRAAIRYACTKGRGGKGTPVLFAAGNGNELVSDDGYAANPDVMAIAASSARDTKSPYSDFGPEIFICAPSSGDSAAGDPRIFTVDRRGASGYNAGNASLGDAAGDYTSRFGGTSSATPLVAGVIGLMISANPQLTLADIRRILRNTAEKIGDRSLYDANGHSDEFGYGRVNALAAVEQAMGGTGGTTSGGAPAINGPASASPSSPPTFTVSLGGRRMYAVELASQASLLDSDNASLRTASNHYGSWVEGLRSDPSYTPPADKWQALAASGQVFYRAHVADDNAWSNYAVTAEAGDAPSVSTGTAGGGPTTGSEPSIQGPHSASATQPPVFQVSLGDRAMYAVELATGRELLDSDNAGARTSANHYGSWVEGLKTDATYTPPAGVWSALAASGRVYYVGHFADDTQWSNYAVSVEPDQAPSISVSGAAGGGAATASSIRYPSGVVIPTVSQPADGKDYSDPVANGLIPLIDVQGREQTMLSTNFALRELRAPGARYARVAPSLVQALQAIRTKLGRAVKIDSAYRHPALNASLDGDPSSEHLTGRAAVVRGLSSSVSPEDIARAALDAITDPVSLGLGASCVYIDVAGRSSLFTFDGASMTDDEFESWAQGIRRRSRNGRLERSRKEFSERARPAIAGPVTIERSAPSLAFEVRTGVNPYFAVQVAAHWSLLAETHAGQRTPETHYATWETPTIGLIPAEVGGVTTFTLPADAWQRLSRHDTLYYRVLSASERQTDWPGLMVSVDDESAADAPRVRVITPSAARDEGDGPNPFASHELDARAWG
ncbi:MAG TPA: S8 family serine peptidase [Gemmatimonadales bacterium]|nr:S8 family serine peptidase [Gemmatimonadales bacterium]